MSLSPGDIKGQRAAGRAAGGQAARGGAALMPESKKYNKKTLNVTSLFVAAGVAPAGDRAAASPRTLVCLENSCLCQLRVGFLL